MKYVELWRDSFEEKIVEFKSAEEAINDTHAILILTEWDEFKTLPYASYYSNVHKPAYIFDGRSILNEEQVSRSGFNYVRIGKRFVAAEE